MNILRMEAVLSAFILAMVLCVGCAVERHSATVKCPIVETTTYVARKDDGSEVSKRKVKVSCDYAAADAPGPFQESYGGQSFNEGGYIFEEPMYPRTFSDVANGNPNIAKGTVFVCTATWKGGYSRLENCRV